MSLPLHGYIINTRTKGNNSLSRRSVNVIPKKPPVPKGCNEYFFNHIGDWINKNDGIYAFKCIASSDKVAVNKFNKWLNTQ